MHTEMLFGKTRGKRPVGRQRYIKVDHIKTDRKGALCEHVNWIDPVQNQIHDFRLQPRGKLDLHSPGILRSADWLFVIGDGTDRLFPKRR